MYVGFKHIKIWLKENHSAKKKIIRKTISWFKPWGVYSDYYTRVLQCYLHLFYVKGKEMCYSLYESFRILSPLIYIYIYIYMVNFDGTMFGESDEVGIGVVIWNFEGEVMAGLSEKI